MARHACVLYLCVAELANVDPMYQFSLAYFVGLFLRAMEECPKHPAVPRRLALLQVGGEERALGGRSEGGRSEGRGGGGERALQEPQPNNRCCCRRVCVRLSNQLTAAAPGGGGGAPHRCCCRRSTSRPSSTPTCAGACVSGWGVGGAGLRMLACVEEGRRRGGLGASDRPAQHRARTAQHTAAGCMAQQRAPSRRQRCIAGSMH